MARRSSLPGADELFRATAAAPAPAATAPTVTPTVPQPAPDEDAPSVPAASTTVVAHGPTLDASAPARSGIGPNGASPASGRRAGGGSGVRRVSRAKPTEAEHQPSGRERHEEKITVYVSPQELLELERARWVLRAEHGLASDRGRIVREAVAVVLADLAAKGSRSILVTRLQELENR